MSALPIEKEHFSGLAIGEDYAFTIGCEEREVKTAPLVNQSSLTPAILGIIAVEHQVAAHCKYIPAISIILQPYQSKAIFKPLTVLLFFSLQRISGKQREKSKY